MTAAPRIILRMRNRRLYVTGIDWDTGELLTSCRELNAMHFPDVTAARTFAQQHRLPRSAWRMVAFRGLQP